MPVKRYTVRGISEAEFEPGSRGRVLANLLGLHRKSDINAVETRQLLKVLERSLSRFDDHHRFTVTDVQALHREWLGSIYEWAGRYRQINMSKGSFLFASSSRISSLMDEWGSGPLRKYTPCRFKTIEEIAEALAIVHAEFILIHPFREGNGRLARLAVLMASQAGLPPLDFRDIARGKARDRYFAAIQGTVTRNYAPLTELFLRIIKRTLRSAGDQKEDS